MKRLIIVIMAVVMIAVVFAGCANDNKPSPTSTARPTATIFPNDYWDVAPTVAPDGGVPTTSPARTPTRTSATSPGPMMNPDL